MRVILGTCDVSYMLRAKHENYNVIRTARYGNKDMLILLFRKKHLIRHVVSKINKDEPLPLSYMQ